MLKIGLEDEGFKQNKVDPCIFLRKTFIVIFYVDDFVYYPKTKR